MTFAVNVLAGSLTVAVAIIAVAVAQRIRDRHEHGPWIIVGTRYTPPDGSITSLKAPPGSSVEDLLYGYTTLTERCGDHHCGLIRTRQLRGQVLDDAAVR